MPRRISRPLFGLLALASAIAFARPADAATSGDQVYDAVNAYEAIILPNSELYRPFSIKGILHGQAAEQTVTYQFFDSPTADRFAPTCERLALIAMKDAGHYSFVVTMDTTVSTTGITGCRLERR